MVKRKHFPGNFIHNYNDITVILVIKQFNFVRNTQKKKKITGSENHSVINSHRFLTYSSHLSKHS